MPNRHGGCMSIPKDRMRGTIEIGALHRPSVTAKYSCHCHSFRATIAVKSENGKWQNNEMPVFRNWRFKLFSRLASILGVWFRIIDLNHTFLAPHPQSLCCWLEGCIGPSLYPLSAEKDRGDDEQEPRSSARIWTKKKRILKLKWDSIISNKLYGRRESHTSILTNP